MHGSVSMRAGAAIAAAADGALRLLDSLVRHLPLAIAADGSGPALIVHPTFRAQPADAPTFTIRFTNDYPYAIDFGPDRINAFFRGMPVPLYDPAERAVELRQGAQRREIAHAIVGTVAAAAVLNGLWHGGTHAAIGAAHGSAAGSRGAVHWHSHTPLGGLLVGAAVVGIASHGIRQLEHDSDSEAAVAAAMLRPRRVQPGQAVIGQIVLKACCETRVQGDDVIRIEIALAPATTVFAFARSAAADDPTKGADTP